uniref:cadherin-like domain-containing protein n=1 Tax=Crenothrix sp. TaxID=3100433 RepID=UPI00374CD50B
MVALNTNPTGAADLLLAAGTEDFNYTITAADLLHGFSDAEQGTNLFIDNLSASTGTVLNNNDGTWTFVPYANINGTVNLTYDVIDGQGGSVGGAQSFTITAVNDSPVAAANPVLPNATEDTPYSILAFDLLKNFTDVDSNALSVVGLTTNHGTLTAVPGGWTFQPALNYNGPVVLNYSVTDGSTGITPTTQSFNVTPVNDAPVGPATAVLAAGTEDTPYTILTSALLQGISDVENDTFSIDTVVASHGSVIAAITGGWTYTPDLNYNGPVQLTYNVTDIHGASTEITQNFSLAAVNDAPTAAGLTISVDEDSTYIFSAADFGYADIDEDAMVSVKITAMPSSGLLEFDGTAVTLNQVVLAGDINLLTFTPDLNTNGLANSGFSFTVNDGELNSAPSAITFDVSAVNDAPKGADKTIAVLEDNIYTFTSADFGYTDVEASPMVSVKITTLPPSGFLEFDGEPVILNQIISTAEIALLTFTPVLNTNGVENSGFGFTVNDGELNSAASAITFDVTAVNDAPTAENKSITVPEDNTYNFTAADFGYDDIEANPMVSIKITVLPESGSLQLEGAVVTLNQVILAADIALLTFTPALNTNGAENSAFSFTVNDGELSSTASVINFNVEAVNDAPTGADKAITVLEDNTYTFTAADFGYADLEGVAMASVQITTLPSSGLLVWDGDPVTLNQVIDASDIQYLTFTPALNANGLANSGFGFTVNDGNSYSTASAITFNVTPVNDPTTGAATFVFAPGIEDHTYIIHLTDLVQGFSDADTNSLSVSNLTATDGTLFNNNNGTWTFTPNANYNGAVALTYNVFDGSNVGGNSIAATRSFSLTAVNDTPTGTASAAMISGTEDAAYTILANTLLQGFNDADGDALTVSNLTASHGTLVPIVGGWIFTPAANYSGAVALTYNVIDDNGGSIPATQSFSLAAQNDGGPVITSSTTGTVAENSATSTVIYTATSTDVDEGDTATYSFKTGLGDDASLLTINAITGEVTLKAPANFEAKASYSFTVVSTDAGGLSAEQAVVATVTDVNEAPVITSGTTGSVAENAAVSTVIYTATATDVDAGDTRTYSFKTVAGDDAPLLSIDATTGAVTLLISANLEAKASYSFTVVSTDAGGLSAEQAVVATVTNVNEGLAITSGTTGSIAENAAISTVIYTATATDVDAGDTRTYSFKTVAGDDTSMLSIDAATGAVTLLNPANFEAKDSYSFTVVSTDAGGLSAEQAVVATVTNVNEAPVITSGTTGSVAENAAISTVIYTATATDVDANDTATYSLKAGEDDSALLSIDAVTGAVTLKDSTNFEAKDSYSFTVVSTDAGGLSAEQAVVATVTDVNEAPVITSSTTGSVAENAPVSTVIYTVTSEDMDDNDTATYSLKAGEDDSALLNIDAVTGAVTLKDSANFEAKDSYSFTVVSTDAGGLSAEQAVVATVTNVNEAPMMTSATTGSVAENAPVSTIIYTATATDVDAGDTRTYSFKTVPGDDAPLLSIDAATGAVILLSSANFEAKASYSFTVVSTDAGGL